MTNITKVVTLDETSWAGISLGATHSYGKLICDDADKTIELIRPITPEQSRKLYPEEFDDHVYEETSRFDSQGQLYAFAKETWRKHFPGPEFMLTLGDELNPNLVLDGGTQALRATGARAASLYIGGYELGDEEVDEAYENWTRQLTEPLDPRPRTLGWWAMPKSKRTCSACNRPAIVVPREGHELSEFWRLERPEEVLMACTHGCKEPI